MPSITPAHLLLLFLCASFAAVLLFAAPAAQAQTRLDDYISEKVKNPELKAAVDAFNAGDYETVLRVAEPLAKQGDREAQRIVGVTRLVIEAAKESPPAEEELRKKKYEAAEQLFEKEGRYEEAIEVLRTMADGGDAEAHYRLYQLFSRIARMTPPADAQDPHYQLKTNDPSGRSFYHLEQASQLGHKLARFYRALNYLQAYNDTGDTGLLDTARAWAIRAAQSGELNGAPSIMYNSYCLGPTYDRDTQLSAAWFMIFSPDDAYGQAPEILDQKWDKVRDQWEHSYCDKSIEITKDFVRDAHRRALALSEAYGLEVQCAFPGCPGKKTFWAPLPR
jgi:TPR repeat protein